MIVIGLAEVRTMRVIREKYENFDNDEDLLSYFREVLERRDELDRGAENN